jgi:hypothetical protein
MKKLLLVLGFVLFVGGGSVWAAVEEPAVIVVRVSDGYFGVTLVIERGAEKQEILKFDTNMSEKTGSEAARSYQQLFARLYQQGYVLQGSFPGTASNGGSSTSTLIFVKAPKP